MKEIYLRSNEKTILTIKSKKEIMSNHLLDRSDNPNRN